VKKLPDNQGFVDRFGRDSRRLQLLFLSDADKSWLADPAIRGRATGQFPPVIVENIFSC